MDQTNRERIVRQYVDYVLAMQRNGEVGGDMRQVARGLGMSEAEIDEVARTADIYFQQGSVHRRAERYEEAIEQLTVATAIDPGDPRKLTELAAAYMGRGIATRNREDKAEAKRIIQRVIEIEPDHHAALALLKGLEEKNERKTDPPPAAGGNPVKRVKWVFAVAGFNMIVMGMVFFFLTKEKKPRTHAVPAVTRQVPATLEGGASALNLQVDDSHLDGGDLLYHLRGRITGAGLAGKDVKLKAIDSAGKVALSMPLGAIPCPGDPGSLCFDVKALYVTDLQETHLTVEPTN